MSEILSSEMDGRESPFNGRMRKPMEPAGRSSSAPTGWTARFAWDGDRLQSVTVSSEAGGQPEYRRDLSYTGDRLVSESVSYNGKHSKITYKYQGDKLVEADVEDSGPHDGGRVRFF